MTDPQKPSERLRDLDARLSELRRKRAPEPPRPKGHFAGAELAWRMVIDLTAGIAVGAAMGWGLDSLFGTKPLFLILLTLFGFGAGVRVMLQSARSLNDKNRAERAQNDATGDGGR